MLFFAPFALAYRLRDNTLSEREKFGYVIAVVVVRLLAQMPNYLLNSSMGASLAEMVFSAVVTLIGVRVCFATNTRGDNKHFIERALCLSVPISVWLNVLPTYLYFALYLSGFFSGAVFARYYAPISFAIYFVAGVMFILNFVLLNRLIEIAASISPSRNKSNSAPIASP